MSCGGGCSWRRPPPCVAGSMRARIMQARIMRATRRMRAGVRSRSAVPALQARRHQAARWFWW
jgi:hypothetical protein